MSVRAKRKPDDLTTAQAAALVHEREVGWGRGCGVSELFASRVASDIEALVTDVISHLEVRESTRANEQALTDLDAVREICRALKAGVAQ